jgi:anti-sigma B factor antagonist
MSTAEAGALVLEYRLESDVIVATVAGEVDVSTSGALREGLLHLISDQDTRALVVNLAGIRFIDSTGIGVLVGVWHRVRATQARLALAAPSRQALSVLDTTGLTQVLPVYDTEAAAISACREPPAS